MKGCLLAGLMIAAVLPGGCQSHKIRRTYTSPFPEAYTLAIVPFRNLSGSDDLDVMVMTDEFYAELQQVKGSLQVIPVNRVLATLNDLGMVNVDSPDDVMLLAETLGAEGVLVGTVTRYDPYPPPQIGITVQLYLQEDRLEEGRTLRSINPGELSRAASPVELPAGPPIKPRAMVVRILDAGDKAVRGRIEAFGRERGETNSPSSWRKWLTRRNYLRFACHEVIGELLAQEKQRLQ